MNQFRYDYAVIGGDLRQVYLANELEKTGRPVCHFALCQPVKQFFPENHSQPFTTLEAAVTNARRIVCPIPLSKDQDSLNQSGVKKNIHFKQLLSLLAPGQLFFAGCIPDDFSKEACKKSILVYDLMKDPILSYFNTIATAEGVICEAIRLSPVNLHKSRCAVLGYGKCVRTLTDDLKSMRCYVTVVSAFEEELAQAVPSADEVLDFSSFSNRIGQYDFIFNTVPALVLTKEALLCANPVTRILDIASFPGGVDFDAAKELNIPAVSCPGLPGKYAPLSSARAILQSIRSFETPYSGHTSHKERSSPKLCL